MSRLADTAGTSRKLHHDIWDYDAPNPIILFEAKYKGRVRKGLAQAGKTGWVYILDRTNGKPLLGIKETPVMQEPRQATSPTQPIPVGDALVAQSIAIAPEDHEVVNEGRIFTPFAEKARIFAPLAAVNWPPSAFDPRTQWMIRASEGANGARMDATQFSPPTFTKSFRGGDYAGAGTQTSNIYSALDLTTNRIVWQKRFNDGCRSGSLVTAGGLVFLGRNDGRVTASDSANGDRLWQFQTEAAVNSAVSTFMHKGQQMLVTYAGGGFVSAKKGDGVWLFSLEGTMEELPSGRPAASSAPVPLAQAPVPAAADGGCFQWRASLQGHMRVLPWGSWPGRRGWRQGDLRDARCRWRPRRAGCRSRQDACVRSGHDAGSRWTNLSTPPPESAIPR